MITMPTLEQVASRPSGWDSRNNYTGKPLENFKDVYVVMTRTRDSNLLTESNWETAINMLGWEDGKTVIIHRFGHWACGWWEALCVAGDKIPAGQALVDQMAHYPILDESDFSERKWESAASHWKSLSVKERVELCQRFEVPIFRARHDDIPSGDFFNDSLFDYLIEGVV